MGSRAAVFLCASFLAVAGVGLSWPQAPARMLEIREGNRRVLVGEVFQFHVDTAPAHPVARGLSWASSAPGVASIDQDGRLTAHSIGSALVTASEGIRSDTVVVSVFPDAAAILDPLPASPPAAHAWPVAMLRERSPVGPPSEKAAARILAERWIELWLPERAYDLRYLDDRERYSIASPDDPNYAQSVDVQYRRPVRIQHRCFPERAPFTAPSDVKVAGQGSEDRQPGYIIVVYRIFLKVPADRPLVPGRTYTVAVDPAVIPGTPEHPAVTSLAVAYSGDDAKELIHVNQEAWVAEGPKVGYLSGWLGVDGVGSRGWVDFPGELPGWDGTFSLIPVEGGNPVFTAPVSRSDNPAEDRYSGSEVYLLDFSAFSSPGRYRIHVPGVGLSCPFSIGPEGFDFVVYTVLRGMTQLRDGDHGLDAPEVTRWNRPPAHLDDAVEQSTGLPVDLAGGHMDAGDREKIPLNMALAASYYLTASRLFPDRVEAVGEGLQIPESGNGIPDYLDELFYELDCVYKMVANTHSGGAMTAWIKPAKGNFEKGYPPEGAAGRVWYDGRYGRFKSATLAVAGALAMAAADPLVRKYSAAPHPDRAAAYLRAAELAWSAYATHEYDNAWWQDDGALNAGVWRLGRHPHSSELIFAAANLFEATGRQTYLDHLEAEWPSGPMDLVLYGSDAGGLVFQDYLSVALCTRPALPARIRNQAHDWILQVTDAMNALPRGKPVFGILFQGAVEGAVGWFFSGLRTGLPNLVSWGLTKGAPKGDRYRDRVVACWNYLLGANPPSVSHITGLGDPATRPRWIVNEIWDHQWRRHASDGAGWIEPPPGLVEGDLQHGDFNTWFDSPRNSARVRRMDPSLDSVPLFYRHMDGWVVYNEASSHTAAVMAAIALPFFR